MSAYVQLTEIELRPGGRAIISSLTASVAAGELVAIVGPNGAGKTTLLRAMAGLIEPSRGVVQLMGAAPGARQRRNLARELAYVPQQYELAFPFTVGEVVLMGRYPFRRGPGLDDADDVAHATTAMNRFGLTELEHRRFDTLSGGEQRRTLLAQASCQGAACVLLDEPTAALDPAHAREVFAGLRAMVDEPTTPRRAAVVVTHDLNLAARWATSLWVLADGQLVVRGTPMDVIASTELKKAFAVELFIGTLPSGEPFVVPT